MYAYEVEEFKKEFEQEAMKELYNLLYERGVHNMIVKDNPISNIAYLSIVSIGNAVGIIGEDEGEVADELERLYEQALEYVSRLVSERTKEYIEFCDTTSFYRHCITTYKGECGWEYYFYGVTNKDILFESEVVSSFANREAAIKDALDNIYNL